MENENWNSPEWVRKMLWSHYDFTGMSDEGEVALSAKIAAAFNAQAKRFNSGKTLYEQGYADGVAAAVKAGIEAENPYKQANEKWPLLEVEDEIHFCEQGRQAVLDAIRKVGK